MHYGETYLKQVTFLLCTSTLDQEVLTLVSSKKVCSVRCLYILSLMLLCEEWMETKHEDHNQENNQLKGSETLNYNIWVMQIPNIFMCSVQ